MHAVVWERIGYDTNLLETKASIYIKCQQVIAGYLRYRYLAIEFYERVVERIPQERLIPPARGPSHVHVNGRSGIVVITGDPEQVSICVSTTNRHYTSGWD